MKTIDGKALAQRTRAEIAAGVAALKAEKGVTPGLAVILVGDNPASVSYVTAKEKACTEAGMLSREIRLPAETTEAELVSLVKELNAFKCYSCPVRVVFVLEPCIWICIRLDHS